MNTPAIYVTKRDMQRLRSLLDNPDLMRQKPYLEQLERELDRANVVESSQIPTDTITMDSTALLIDLQTGEEMILTLVYPDHAYIPEGRISVLAPVGMAILGCRQGEIVEWEVPEGTRSLKVGSVLYQPEASGDYML
jgi:regulator of nucleoside diphosphate kinase